MVICITDNLQNFLQKICSKLLLSLHPAWNVAFFLAFQTCQLYHRLNIPQRFSFLLPEHPRQGTRQYRSGACSGTNSIIFRAKLVAAAPGWAGWTNTLTEVSCEGVYVGCPVSTGYNPQTVLSGVTAHGVEGISLHGCSLHTCRHDVLPMFGCTSHTTTPMYTNTADKPQPIVSGVSGQAHGHKTARYRADVKNPFSKPVHASMYAPGIFEVCATRTPSKGPQVGG